MRDNPLKLDCALLRDHVNREQKMRGLKGSAWRPRTLGQWFSGAFIVLALLMLAVVAVVK